LIGAQRGSFFACISVFPIAKTADVIHRGAAASQRQAQQLLKAALAVV
jgi:hypothetical protein